MSRDRGRMVAGTPFSFDDRTSLAQDALDRFVRRHDPTNA